MTTVFWAGFWTFLLDQASKYFVVHFLDLRVRGEIDVLPPFINLRMAWNTGINFGLFADNGDVARWFLIGMAFVICAAVLFWVHKDRPGRLGLISAGLLIGGALGNVVDRFLYGAVADFLNMTCCGISNPYAFNVADITIFIGAFGLVLWGGPQKAT
ncbi:Lipoprotein signal peptidase [Thalassovita autumnalis]|uniref:Lipoprotein signal peptidase n=1 Tax=Thalassovita autumnalis TaxID=2072972 RepID=A0A0N7LX52_9RHOB|nr:signal peptidase II [Thalassovita autumnalis]CUH69857.1 Lipoprotein signal peptidase [Thalassovita autumnalis]CUH70935.1 Lipoprotein signal peptidase [Thalassovita autumnalis]